MRRFFMFLILLGCVTSIAACGSAPAPTEVPIVPTRAAVVASPTTSNAPTQTRAADVPAAVLPTVTNEPDQAVSVGSNAEACATENHAPLDAFRSDSPDKLTASAKPKFIEFYAVW